MHSTFKRLFYTNKNKVKADGTKAILRRITIDGANVVISTGESTTPHDWNVKQRETMEKKRRELSLRIFLFSVFTGLACADLQRLRVSQSETNSEGKRYIRKARQKNGSRAPDSLAPDGGTDTFPLHEREKQGRLQDETGEKVTVSKEGLREHKNTKEAATKGCTPFIAASLLRLFEIYLGESSIDFFLPFRGKQQLCNQRTLPHLPLSTPYRTQSTLLRN